MKNYVRTMTTFEWLLICDFFPTNKLFLSKKQNKKEMHGSSPPPFTIFGVKKYQTGKNIHTDFKSLKIIRIISMYITYISLYYSVCVCVII